MRPASVFSNNMVLLRDRKTCIFGEGTDGEVIKVRLKNMETGSEETAEAVAQEGTWKTFLPAHAAGGSYELIITGATEECVLQNVTFGEVWIAAGQSNMELELQNAQDGEQELATDNPDIRYYNVVKSPVADDSLVEQEKYRFWHSCVNGDFRDISGVAYFFAKELAKKIGVPIGIIDCFQGGTSISCWLSEENLVSVPEGIPYKEAYEAVIKDQTEEEYDRLLAEYNQTLAGYNERVDAVKAKNPDVTPEELNEQAGDYPWPPPMGRKSLFRPYGLYYTMVQRIIPYTVQGVLYYQGEEDAQKTERYDVLLKKLIEQYRKDFENPSLPFIYLQLPMFIGKRDTDDYSWGRTRLAQAKAAKEVDNVGLVVLLDLGEFDNVHPVDKRTPGVRTAKYVLEHIYQQDVKGTAMELNDISPESAELKLSFKNTYGKIICHDNGLLDIRHAAEGNDPTGFELSQDGKAWTPAKARIDGEVIYLQADVEKDCYVRYGYFNYGKVNVYNAEELPLAPFLLKRK